MNESGKAAMLEIFLHTLPGYVKAKDIAGYASLFSEDAVWCPPSAPLRTGPAAIAEGFGAMAAILDFDPSFAVVEVEAFETEGQIFGRGTIILTPVGGGQSTTAHSREWWKFISTASGWRIARLMWNLAPAGGQD